MNILSKDEPCKFRLDQVTLCTTSGIQWSAGMREQLIRQRAFRVVNVLAGSLSD